MGVLVTKPKVVVLMPVRNAQETLRAALDSLFYQTYENLHVVVIDDQSTDSSLWILKTYYRPDLPITILSWPGPRDPFNMANCLNLGLETAYRLGADYVARQDADDECDPRRIEQQVELMQHRSLGMCGTWAAVVHRDGQDLIVDEEFHPGVFPGEERRWLLKFNYFIHGSVMMDAKVLRRVGGYTKDLPYVEDYDLWFRIANTAEVGLVPRYLYTLIRGVSSTTGQEGMIYDRARRLREFWSGAWKIPIPDHDLPGYCTRHDQAAA